MCDCAEERERRRREECRDGDGSMCSGGIDCNGSGGGNGGGGGGNGGSGSVVPSSSGSWSSSAMWLPLISGSAILAFLGLLYRSFTSGTIGMWLSHRGNLSGKCRNAIKNTAAMKNDSVCEVKIDEKKRKWPLEEKKKPPYDCIHMK